MGLTCCLPIRDEDDHPTDDNSNASLSRNPFSSEFRYSLFNKIKGVFHRNEVHVTQPVQRREILNANYSHRIHPNNVQNPPEVAVIRDKLAAFVNRPVRYENLAASSSPNHPNVEIEQNQPSEQNLEAGSVVIPEAAATSEITAEILNTRSCHENHHQSSEQNPVVLDAAGARDSVSMTEEVTAEILINSSSTHENHHQSSEQNPGTDAVPDDSAAATGSDRVTEISNQNVESLQSSEEGLHSETVIDNSCTKEASANMEKTFTDANGVFYEVFPSSDEEDVCPTCLEDYEPENPKIVAECSHHFHLSCIYDWLERSERCPICFRLMVITEN